MACFECKIQGVEGAETQKRCLKKGEGSFSLNERFVWSTDSPDHKDPDSRVARQSLQTWLKTQGPLDTSNTS